MAGFEYTTNASGWPAFLPTWPQGFSVGMI